MIFWFNGGPGCSSMLGLLQENGPYIIDNFETTFKVNNYSWNNAANMVFLEAPAGVGFSICPDAAECKFTDNSTASDNLVALLNIFKLKFPEFMDRDIYLTGESYAGIYIPTLAREIINYNANAKEGDFQPKLKGVLIGNGCTNWKYDATPAMMDVSYYYGLIDDTTY